jgi:nucleoside-diphosphate-sugar epimerase
MAELVLVTGGSGYIAGWCIAELLSRGYEVRTTVRDPGRERSVVNAVSSVASPAERLSFAVADLTADDGWDAAVKGVDYVLHVASPLGGGTPEAMIAAARDGTLEPYRDQLLDQRHRKGLIDTEAQGP